jgi:prevent-host-death family protein
MSAFGLFDAKNRLSELVARADAGEEIVITKHGRPAARLVPYAQPDEAEVRRKRIEESLERIRRMREEMEHRLSIDEILEARHEGHRY